MRWIIIFGIVLIIIFGSVMAQDKALTFPFSGSQGSWSAADWNRVQGPYCLYIKYVDYAEIKVCCPSNYTLTFYPVDRKYQQVTSLTFENANGVTEVDMKVYRPGAIPAVKQAPAGWLSYHGENVTVYKNVIGQNFTYVGLDKINAVVVCQFSNQSLAEEILNNMQITPPDMQRFYDGVIREYKDLMRYETI